MSRRTAPGDVTVENVVPRMERFPVGFPWARRTTMTGKPSTAGVGAEEEASGAVSLCKSKPVLSVVCKHHLPKGATKDRPPIQRAPDHHRAVEFVAHRNQSVGPSNVYGDWWCLRSSLSHDDPRPAQRGRTSSGQLCGDSHGRGVMGLFRIPFGPRPCKRPLPPDNRAWRPAAEDGRAPARV
ncbi:hypothetical protein G7046_g4987 [Stylonectria norvegica]|nr:hypothetical protein G7046_g4987 [Stylonectria norvegica]